MRVDMSVAFSAASMALSAIALWRIRSHRSIWQPAVAVPEKPAPTYTFNEDAAIFDIDPVVEPPWVGALLARTDVMAWQGKDGVIHVDHLNQYGSLPPKTDPVRQAVESTARIYDLCKRLTGEC